MTDPVVESMRVLAQFGNHLDGLFGTPPHQNEPLVTIPMSEYERLKSGIPTIQDMQQATFCHLAILQQERSHNAEMIQLRNSNAELQEENEKLRQELKKLKNRKKWRIFR